MKTLFSIWKARPLTRSAVCCPRSKSHFWRLVEFRCWSMTKARGKSLALSGWKLLRSYSSWSIWTNRLLTKQLQRLAYWEVYWSSLKSLSGTIAYIKSATWFLRHFWRISLQQKRKPLWLVTHRCAQFWRKWLRKMSTLTYQRGKSEMGGWAL